MEDRDNTPDSRLKEIYQFKNIAVVGMSPTEGKPANYVPKYLIEKGYNVIPVNPIYDNILGRKSYPKVSDIPHTVDIVDIFRKSEDIPPITQDVIQKHGIKVLWMQLGIHNQEARETAEKNGLEVIYNRCILREHQRLFL
ncbi:CoA-binding protein [Candidatus Nitrosocosmicus hydrocola]|uniref:CoA-binding protein n=1 Tax=Candidatus Nitrosocosmicus hydrocola TaxID=1826872 RepID=UPI0011E5B6C6|nr:CoA-binding protein [Candidatus Nitrosocosmicus hydrocola]